MAKNNKKFSEIETELDMLFTEMALLYDAKIGIFMQSFRDTETVCRICRMDDSEVAELGRMVKENIDSYIKLARKASGGSLMDKRSSVADTNAQW